MFSNPRLSLNRELSLNGQDDHDRQGLNALNQNRPNGHNEQGGQDMRDGQIRPNDQNGQGEQDNADDQMRPNDQNGQGRQDNGDDQMRPNGRNLQIRNMQGHEQREVGVNGQQRPYRPQNYLGERYDRPEDWVHIDANTRIHIDIWESMRAKSDSKFVRELARCLWSDEILRQKCLDVIRANRGREINDVQFRNAITPQKVQIIKDCLYNKITDSGIEGRLRNARVNKYWKYLSAKIYDVRRNLQDELNPNQ
ncbi:uncharacterized protein PF3D7_1120600-like [Leptopilina boulardi]|uniref:uncharacterized protein PF3D7_1120600-like n=1 Tax=Leptopilina boulardi TaxID=63433 RepID=UPI0021F5A6FE|nr:uncharacterized protein PF3D7_1120600-like [Leptopilina boulardi]